MLSVQPAEQHSACIHCITHHYGGRVDTSFLNRNTLFGILGCIFVQGVLKMLVPVVESGQGYIKIPPHTSL